MARIIKSTSMEESRPAARRWFSPYQEYEPRTRLSLAPAADARPRAIVVEQGQALSNLLRHYVDDLEVTTLSRLEEVGAAIEAEPSSALLINQMPSANPSESLDHLPSLAFDIPIIACWVPERTAAISPMGVQDYLIKPIRRQDLLASIMRTAPEARRILLVEDDDEARQLFLRMLSAAEPGYSVAYASDGEGALAMMGTQRPDLVLLDLIIPGLNGFEVLAIKGEDAALRDIPVIVISAKDPHREPIMSNALVLTRQSGLSARDLVVAVQAVMAALPPRFGDPTLRETPAPLPASG